MAIFKNTRWTHESGSVEYHCYPFDADVLYHDGKKYFNNGGRGDRIGTGTQVMGFTEVETGERIWADEAGQIYSDIL